MNSSDLTEDPWYARLGTLGFDETLRGVIADLGHSLYRVSEFSNVDRPYLLRLTTGEKARPSRKTVLAVGAALTRLGADLLVIDDLLAAAGHLPVFVIHGVKPLNQPEKEFLEQTAKKRLLNMKKRKQNK